MKSSIQVVAEAIRIEINSAKDEVFLVFEITDPDFKKYVKENWSKDLELKLLGKQLIK